MLDHNATLQNNNDIYSRDIYLAGPEAFFTICSKNFLAHARTLHKSVNLYYPKSRFFLVLCDRVEGFIEPTEEPFEFIYLEELNLPNLDEMAERYNITEFNTAVKPFAFLHLMNQYGFNSVVYLDPDLLLVSRMEELDSMLMEGAEAVLTPHILQPAEHDEVNDASMLLFGIYNLGFLALSNTSSVQNFLSWWGRRLEHHCIIQLDKGIFVDQKWADLLPAFVKDVYILHHPGYNVAYWNLPQRRITLSDDIWLANGQPLRFVHFSGSNIDDPNVFSRHSQQVTIDSIGELRYLLDYYREQVFEQGHQFYRKLPYAYNWEGELGENLHTPKTLDMSKSKENGEPINSDSGSEESQNKGNRRKFDRLRIMWRALPLALRLSGGFLPLIKRAFSAYKRNGWEHVKEKIIELSHIRLPQNIEDSFTTSSILNTQVKKRLLYLDWSIPKPDQDAASVTAISLIRIFQSLGYSVTFIPCGLKYEEGYYEALVSQGTEVLCYPHINSVDSWLRDNAVNFNVCFLARGPVVWPYLKTLKSNSPDTKLIFNTVDLHYIREMREAKLSGDDKALNAAMDTRKHELELIEQCNLTILLSSEELYMVRKELPEAPLAVLPIVFDDIPGACKPFTEKKDILFIGSFLHQPNVDAVLYFVESIFPLIRQRIPDVRFKVVGSNPPENILRLADNPDIDVLGFVKEIRPLFEKVRLSIAPLRYGAGIKGKIGSSLCYGVPCVATSIANEGMGLIDGYNILLGDTDEDFADMVYRAYTEKSLWQKISIASYEFALENYSIDVIRQRVHSILWSVQEGWRPIESAFEIDSWNAWQKHREHMHTQYMERLKHEEELLPINHEGSFSNAGFCCVCGRETSFLTSFMYSVDLTSDGKPMPNWREHMQCEHCGLVNRMRAALNALHTLAPPKKEDRIYITEHVTPMYRWLNARYVNIQGSEYLGEEYKSGDLIRGIRHEDIMNLSFSHSSFDRVLSFDVLEHVHDPDSAFREIYRVLDNTGVFLFTVPFASDSPSDIVRATISTDGSIEHHMPPEYHGNPVNPEAGALCFRYFGWELLNKLRSIGFIRVRVLAYWSEKQGYLGREQYLFIAQKP